VSPWQDVLRDCTLMNGNSIMVLPNYGPNPWLLPTRDDRFVFEQPEYLT
jgi:hypothetical protein